MVIPRKPKNPNAWSKWAMEHVPEADDAAKIRAIAHGLTIVSRMVLSPDLPIENAQMRAAEINAKSAKIVAAWDSMEASMFEHPTYRADIRSAMRARGCDTAQAALYAAALRSVIDEYRKPLRLPKGGRARSHNRELFVQAVAELRRVLSVSEVRAAEIAAHAAEALGVSISPGALRVAARDRRLQGR